MSEAEICLQVMIKMAYAVACGFLVGVERKVNDASAGFKTQILVCAGAMLFTVVPDLAGIHQEEGRVIAQVASGVGFLGAGAILHTGSRSVVGLTTAAWIWFTAAVGVLVGVDHGPLALLVTGTLVGVITLARGAEKIAFPTHSPSVREQRKAA